MKSAFVLGVSMLSSVLAAQALPKPFPEAKLKDLGLEQGPKYYSGHNIVQCGSVLVPRDKLSKDAILLLASYRLDGFTLAALEAVIARNAALDGLIKASTTLTDRDALTKERGEGEEKFEALLDLALRPYVSRPFITPNALVERRAKNGEEHASPKISDQERFLARLGEVMLIFRRSNAFGSRPPFALKPDLSPGGAKVTLLTRREFEDQRPSEEEARWTQFYDLVVPQAVGYDPDKKRLIVLVPPESFRQKKARVDEQFVVALRGDASAGGVYPYTIQPDSKKLGKPSKDAQGKREGRPVAPVFDVPKDFAVESIDTFSVENAGPKTDQELLGHAHKEFYLDPGDGMVKSRDAVRKADLQAFDYDLIKPNLVPDLIFPLFGEPRMPYTEFEIAGRLSTDSLDKKALETVSFRTISNADNALQLTAIRGLTFYGNERVNLLEAVTDLGLRTSYALPFVATKKKASRLFPARDSITPVADFPADVTLQASVQTGTFIKFDRRVFGGPVDSPIIARARVSLETGKIPLRGLPLKLQLTGALYINPVQDLAGGRGARVFEEGARVSLLIPAGKQDLRISYVGGSNPATAFKRTPYTVEFSLDVK